MNDLTQLAQNLQQDFATAWPGPRGDVVTLKNDALTVEIYPHDGCRIRQITALGHRVLREYDDTKKAFQYGCFPMVPWVGRVEDGVFTHEGQKYELYHNKGTHAMHGMAHMSYWDVLYSSQTKALFKLQLQKPWPFAGFVLQEISICDNKLTTKLTVISEDDRSFPASLGWHPWWKKDLGTSDVSKLMVSMKPDFMEERGAGEVGTGNKAAVVAGPYDDTFGWDEPLSVNLHWGTTLKCHIESSGRFLTVFDKLEDATCVNTMTDAPNGINHSTKFVVSKTRPLCIKTAYTFAV